MLSVQLAPARLSATRQVAGLRLLPSRPLAALSPSHLSAPPNLLTMTLADPDIPSSKLLDLINDGLSKVRRRRGARALVGAHFADRGLQMSDEEKKKNIKQVNGIFEMRIKSGKTEKVWTIDLKKVSSGFCTDLRSSMNGVVEYSATSSALLRLGCNIAALTVRRARPRPRPASCAPISSQQDGKVYAGPAKPKADVTINLSDDTFQSVRCYLGFGGHSELSSAHSVRAVRYPAAFFC